MTRLAVVLFNLGGPDGPEAVRPFLFNLFRDPAIIGAPAIVRYPLATLISRTREKMARANYALMGGGSPILPETRRQAAALEALLKLEAPEIDTRVFIAMRYWKPLTDETARQVAAFEPDEIVLLPLYPQFSTTTTESSFKEWIRCYRGSGRARAICCYPTAEGLVASHAHAIEATWAAAGMPSDVRLLFSAHGLPEKIIKAGDPYQAQIEATAAAVAARLPSLPDWTICYQSRVGPMKWLGPSTVEEIERAARDGKGVIVAPVAFVSEHVETLVELDQEYAALARAVGCTPYLRAPTPSVDTDFLEMLTDAVSGSLAREGGAAPFGDWRCPASFGKCVCMGEPG